MFLSFSIFITICNQKICSILNNKINSVWNTLFARHLEYLYWHVHFFPFFESVEMLLCFPSQQVPKSRLPKVRWTQTSNHHVAGPGYRPGLMVSLVTIYAAWWAALSDVGTGAMWGKLKMCTYKLYSFGMCLSRLASWHSYCNK